MASKINPEAATLQEEEKEEQNGQEQATVKKPWLSQTQRRFLVGVGGAGVLGLELYLILYSISIFLPSN
ncbi:unnamed protein product [Blepharisma stoltei]|uniref:Uncharacterized protein n=1 Tax=Blepharisma stoltei TaxID=1481888 RepID=A0AAU9JK10_9CILI|nr:unnamed protein product [Blepharisma stoltei]